MNQENPGIPLQDENHPDDELNQQEEGGVFDETQPGHRNKVRRKIRVRKKIRIRKKPSVKKKIRKYAERSLWTAVVIAFIVALIIMVIELDIRDDKLKQKKKKTPPVKSSTY